MGEERTLEGSMADVLEGYDENTRAQIEGMIEAERHAIAQRRREREDCPCKEGMFPNPGRRSVLYAAGSTLAASVASMLMPARAAERKAPAGAAWREVPGDPTKVPGTADAEDRSGYPRPAQHRGMDRRAIRNLRPRGGPERRCRMGAGGRRRFRGDDAQHSAGEAAHRRDRRLRAERRSAAARARLSAAADSAGMGGKHPHQMVAAARSERQAV